MEKEAAKLGDESREQIREWLRKQLFTRIPKKRCERLELWLADFNHLGRKVVWERSIIKDTYVPDSDLADAIAEAAIRDCDCRLKGDAGLRLMRLYQLRSYRAHDDYIPHKIFRVEVAGGEP